MMEERQLSGGASFEEDDQGDKTRQLSWQRRHEARQVRKMRMA